MAVRSRFARAVARLRAPRCGATAPLDGVIALSSKDRSSDLHPDLEEGGDHALDLVELAGEIKWFDVSKGYGFIVPDNGMPDVLVHVTTLRRDGFGAAREGARVVCEVLQRAKGLQVFRILSLDLSTAVHPSQAPAPRTHVQVVPTGGFEIAVVKWFNRVRGFGFVSPGFSSVMP